MNAALQSVLVALGAAAGANLRYWIGVWAHASSREWPWPTLVINLLGSVVLGIFAITALERGWGDGWRLLVAVGFCGGFTTFSTFSFEVVDLMLQKNYGVAMQYAAASLILCVGGCFLGGHLARVVHR